MQNDEAIQQLKREHHEELEIAKRLAKEDAYEHAEYALKREVKAELEKELQF